MNETTQDPAASVQQETDTYRLLQSNADRQIRNYGSGSDAALDATNAMLSYWRDMSHEAKAAVFAAYSEAEGVA